MFHLSAKGAGFCLLLESSNLSPWFLLAEGGRKGTALRAAVPRCPLWTAGRQRRSEAGPVGPLAEPRPAHWPHRDVRDLMVFTLTTWKVLGD